METAIIRDMKARTIPAMCDDENDYEHSGYVAYDSGNLVGRQAEQSNEWSNLTNAVVMQAVKDWRAAVRALKKQPRNENAKRLKAECERFFKSDWFSALTDADGQLILLKLKQEESKHDS